MTGAAYAISVYVAGPYEWPNGCVMRSILMAPEPGILDPTAALFESPITRATGYLLPHP